MNHTLVTPAGYKATKGMPCEECGSFIRTGQECGKVYNPYLDRMKKGTRHGPGRWVCVACIGRLGARPPWRPKQETLF